MKNLINSIWKLFSKVIGLTLGKKRVIYRLFDDVDKKIFSLHEYGYLKEIGWVKSIIDSKSIDLNNQALPWLTYPFISFLEDRIKNEFNVLEFGSGASTEYFSTKSKSVVSFENDHNWFELMKKRISENVNLNFYYDSPEITTVLNSLNKQFDIVLIDNNVSGSGTERPDLAILSLKYISLSGVLILDDFNTKIYDRIIPFFKANGFKKIDFWGLAPCITYQKCTSILYRDGNCLSI